MKTRDLAPATPRFVRGAGTHILSCASMDAHLMFSPGMPHPASLARKPAKASMHRRPCLEGGHRVASDVCAAAGERHWRVSGQAVQAPWRAGCPGKSGAAPAAV